MSCKQVCCVPRGVKRRDMVKEIVVIGIIDIWKMEPGLKI